MAKLARKAPAKKKSPARAKKEAHATANEEAPDAPEIPPWEDIFDTLDEEQAREWLRDLVNHGKSILDAIVPGYCIKLLPRREGEEGDGPFITKLRELVNRHEEV